MRVLCLKKSKFNGIQKHNTQNIYSVSLLFSKKYKQFSETNLSTGGELSLQTNLQKEEGLTGSQFLEGVTFFRGRGLKLLHKK